MLFNDLNKLTTGFIKGWKKGKLKETLKETAQVAMDEKIKNAELEEKIGQLKDEIHRLKGEKSKPKIKPAVTDKELNPKPRKPHNKKPKNENLEIDETVELDVEDLPKGAKKIGTREVVVQEMEIRRRNIKFVLSRYIVDEEVIEPEIPTGFKGHQFGPRLRSFVLYQYYKCRTPHKKILEMLGDWGVVMSAGTLCSILNREAEEFKDDLTSAKNAAIKKQSRVFIDDTGARVKGFNGYSYGVCNDYFGEYVTGLEKNRWSAVGALLSGQRFLMDSHALEFVAKKLKRAKVTVALYQVEGQEFDRIELEEKFKQIFDFPIRKDELDIVRTAGAISALRRENKIKFIISDDGSNFIDIIRNHQLCWVHEIRKYKKMILENEFLNEQLELVIMRWRYLYRLMKRFRRHPTGELRERIRDKFDNITQTRTGISVIDKQLKLTEANKKRLLLFLTYPQLPLHSNMVERDLRERVIKRKISLQNRSWSGVRAWDLYLSLMCTCRKLGLSFWKYLDDRIGKREAIPYLGRVVNSL